MFHQISKHFEVGLKKSTCASFFNPLLSVWISDETLFLVFDILHTKLSQTEKRKTFNFDASSRGAAAWYDKTCKEKKGTINKTPDHHQADILFKDNKVTFQNNDFSLQVQLSA